MNRFADRWRLARLLALSLATALLLVPAAHGEFPPVVELGELDGTDGVRFLGDESGDLTGYSVHLVGDLDGDGFGEVAIAAPQGSPGGVRTSAGKIYVIYGGPNFPAEIDLAIPDPSVGFVVQGAMLGDVAGSNLGGGGDVNGDGLSDMVVGSPHADPSDRMAAGRTHVVLGRPTFPPTIDLDLVDGTDGFALEGVDPFDASGRNVALIGDYNGDDRDDIAIGAPRSEEPGNLNTGDAFVWFGAAGFPASVELSTVDGNNGFVARGSDIAEEVGWSVAGAGDVDGDGFDDLLIGAPEARDGGDSRKGDTYLLYGGPNPPALALLSDLDPANGVVIHGAAAEDKSGTNVAGGGDVNGDGFDDLIVGAPASFLKTGKGFIIYGSDLLGGEIELSSLGSGGVEVTGEALFDELSTGLAVADLNHDGFDDVLFGAEFANPTPERAEAGRTYVVYGGPALPETLNVADLDGTNGFILNGIDAGDQSGWSVSAGSDVNGDAVDDLVIGALSADPLPGRSAAGEAYVVFGQPVLDLEISGACPGLVTVSGTGATPGGSVAFVSGVSPGETTRGAGPCPDTVMAIDEPVFVNTLPADGSGSFMIERTLAAGFCGRLLQAVDVSACVASDRVVIPGGVR